MLLYILLLLVFTWMAYLTFLFVRLKKNTVKNSPDPNGKMKIGLVKFNPFGNVGSNQSFCMALLMNDKLGIILTSLHGRNGTRVYARQIDLDKDKKEKLSEEEKEAIKKALKVSEK